MSMLDPEGQNAGVITYTFAYRQRSHRTQHTDLHHHSTQHKDSLRKRPQGQYLGLRQERLQEQRFPVVVEEPGKQGAEVEEKQRQRALKGHKYFGHHLRNRGTGRVGVGSCVLHTAA